MALTSENVFAEIKASGNKDYAVNSLRFFKTQEGQYGFGDRFLGVRVPELRRIVSKYISMELEELKKLLSSEFHEVRLCGFLFLCKRFEKGGEEERRYIYELYLKNKKWVNNWDIVDTTAPCVVGGYLLEGNRDLLYNLAVSESIWDRRIAIISTFAFIKKNQFKDTFAIAEVLLKDREDLIHKAAGWMLREIGKRNMEAEEGFLKNHHKKMPRTMLRYAIEKFPEEKRQEYLKGTIA